MKIKTAELTGALLDAAVAMAEGDQAHMEYILRERGADNRTPPLARPYSTEWHVGGPIIEREHILFLWFGEARWEAQISDGLPYVDQTEGYAVPGATPLIAAMRAYVQHKFGDEIELPD